MGRRGGDAEMARMASGGGSLVPPMLLGHEQTQET